MGKDSKKSVTDAEPKQERSGLGAGGDNPEQRPLASGEATGKEGTSLDGSEFEKIETYHKGFQRGYRLGYKQMRDFYTPKIKFLEEQLEHWKELGKL